MSRQAPWWIAAALISAAAILWWLHPAPPLYGYPFPRSPLVGGVTLLGDRGQPVRFSDFRGKFLVIYFGDTRARANTPPILKMLQRTYLQLGRPSRLALMMISIDPAYDRPGVLRRFLANFKPVIGLTGTGSSVAEVAKEFAASYTPHPNLAELSTHTTDLFVVGPRGHLRRVYSPLSLADGHLALGLGRLLGVQ